MKVLPKNLSKKSNFQSRLNAPKLATMILSLLFLLPTIPNFLFAEEITDITGTITARRQGAVKVEFKAHPKAGPKVGDRVEFKTMMQGFEAKAGKGEVTQVDDSNVWVKVLKGRPNLKMTGIIHATGAPGLKEFTFDIKSFDKFDIKDPGATLKIRFPPGWNFKNFGERGYKMEREGVMVEFDASAFLRAKNGTREHRRLMKIRKTVYGEDAKWEPAWADRKLDHSSDCLADHVLNTDSWGVHRRMWATCVDPNARPSSTGTVQIYKLTFFIDKRLAAYKKTHKHWDLPWEDWFVKAVQSLSIKTK